MIHLRTTKAKWQRISLLEHIKEMHWSFLWSINACFGPFQMNLMKCSISHVQIFNKFCNFNFWLNFALHPQLVRFDWVRNLLIWFTSIAISLAHLQQLRAGASRMANLIWFNYLIWCLFYAILKWAECLQRGFLIMPVRVLDTLQSVDYLFLYSCYTIKNVLQNL